MKTFKQLINKLKENFGNSAGLIGGGQLEAELLTPSERSGALRYAPTQGQTNTKDNDDPVKMWYTQQNIKQTENIKQTINMWQNKHAHEIEFKSQQNSLVKGDKSQPGTGQPPQPKPYGPDYPTTRPGGPPRPPDGRPPLPSDPRPPDVRPK
jgi:hypothetical protein